MRHKTSTFRRVDGVRLVVVMSLLALAVFPPGGGDAVAKAHRGIAGRIDGLAMAAPDEIAGDVVMVPSAPPAVEAAAGGARGVVELSQSGLPVERRSGGPPDHVAGPPGQIGGGAAFVNTLSPDALANSPGSIGTASFGAASFGPASAGLASTPAPTSTTTVPPLTPPTFESLDGLSTIRTFTGLTTRGASRWNRMVPGIEQLRIVSTADGSEQPTWWLPPAGDSDQPLLVVLHSWSSTYTQHAGIPFAMWAQENGWAVVAPNFRGINDDAEAVGSDLAVQDAADAIDYATAQPGVDASRVYVVGYSGGGMMGLLLAGRHPERVTAVSVWGPPVDLVEFYRHSRSRGLGYSSDIWRACGGDPRDAGAAQDECQGRSPVTYLDVAREAGVPVFIAQGIRDQYVPRGDGAVVFNHLAHPKDRLSPDQLEALGRGTVPDTIADPLTAESFLGEADPTPVFTRASDSVLLVYFQAGHEMVYGASARWFASDPR